MSQEPKGDKMEEKNEVEKLETKNSYIQTQALTSSTLVS